VLGESFSTCCISGNIRVKVKVIRIELAVHNEISFQIKDWKKARLNDEI